MTTAERIEQIKAEALKLPKHERESIAREFFAAGEALADFDAGDDDDISESDGKPSDSEISTGVNPRTPSLFESDGKSQSGFSVRLSDEFAIELERRIESVHNGTAELIPADVLFAELRTRFPKR